MRTVRFPLEIGLAGILLIGVLLGAAMAKPILITPMSPLIGRKLLL